MVIFQKCLCKKYLQSIFMLESLNLDAKKYLPTSFKLGAFNTFKLTLLLKNESPTFFK